MRRSKPYSPIPRGGLVLPAGVMKVCVACGVGASKRRLIELNGDLICSVCAEIDGRLDEWRDALQNSGQPKKPTPKPSSFGGWS